MGGYPSTTNAYKFMTDSDVKKHLTESNMPDDFSQLSGKKVELQLRQENFEQKPDDVYAVRWSGGGGFGDPLKRDPKKVLEDVDNFAVSQSAACDIYGVVLDETGQLNTFETESLRQSRRDKRIDRTRKITRKGTLIVDISESLQICSDSEGSFFACSNCGMDIASTEKNYKEQCVQEKRTFNEVNPLIGQPEIFIDDSVEYRSFCCPGCGALFDNEIALSSEPILWDIKPAPIKYSS